jgi:hypothetical protein
VQGIVCNDGKLGIDCIDAFKLVPLTVSEKRQSVDNCGMRIDQKVQVVTLAVEVSVAEQDGGLF